MKHFARLALNAKLFLVVGCLALAGRAMPHDDGWKKLNAGGFSIYVPPGWEFHMKRGGDSYLGDFSGDAIVLRFDFGRYSDDLREATEPKYAVTQEKIDGRDTKIVFPHT